MTKENITTTNLQIILNTKHSKKQKNTKKH